MYSCDEFVAVELPASQLNAQDVFLDEATAHSAMIAIYADMRDNGIISDAGYILGNYADELDFYGTSTTMDDFNKNTLIPSNTTVGSWWENAYKLIYSANSIIERCEESTSLVEGDKNQLIAEALFVRSLLHFNLARVYGDVPYIPSTDYQINAKISRTAEITVYQKIIEDLLIASDLIELDYITNDRTRPNKAVVLALLAKVYLQVQNWESARDTANMIINQSEMYPWNDNLDLIFLKESKTTLWQWAPKYDGYNTREGQSYILIATPPVSVTLNQMLVDSFDPSDLRRSKWIGTISDDSQRWYFPFKYKQKNQTASSQEYSIVFRLAEQYLIRSRAKLELGDIQGSLADLNKVHKRAGLSSITTNNPTEIKNRILQERRHELFTEFGHRFFDLKRNGSLDAVLTPIKSAWETTDAYFPIPEDELLLNSNLAPQNPGY